MSISYVLHNLLFSLCSGPNGVHLEGFLCISNSIHIAFKPYFSLTLLLVYINITYFHLYPQKKNAIMLMRRLRKKPLNGHFFAYSRGFFVHSLPAFHYHLRRAVESRRHSAPPRTIFPIQMPNHITLKRNKWSVDICWNYNIYKLCQIVIS